MKRITLLLIIVTLIFIGCSGGDDGVSNNNQDPYKDTHFSISDSTYHTTNKFSFTGRGRTASLLLEYPLDFNTTMMQFSIISNNTTQNHNSKIVLYDTNDKVLFKQKFNMDGGVTLNLDMPFAATPAKLKIFLVDYSGELILQLLGHDGSITEEND